MSALISADRSRPKNARLFERDPHEWYQEPAWATAGLLGVERFVGPIWDPACGGGNVLRACRAAGYRAFGSDIIDRLNPASKIEFAGLHDFLADDALPAFPHPPVDMIFNPPFNRAKGTEAFIRKALTIARGKVAVFVDVKFLASQRRATGLFAEHCPHRVWTLAKRPSCPPGHWLAAGNEAGGGTADWCWIIWDTTAPRVRTYQGGWIRPEAAVTA